MLFRFLLSASIVAGALTPAAVEARSRCGIASFYGHNDGFAGQTMANGKPMNPRAMITAHRSLPLGAKVLVRNPATGKSVTAIVSDRGPYVHGRVLDLSYGAFAKLARPSQGLAKVCYTVV